ncbi:MAG: cob(I)yrinic acid a,c-diamide adenosyltransferase [Acidobacteria bacterium]|jgi:ATP:cob(I)alamin adenosyltransferase|nr:cob(I)yrinic acid a,c-diamide adenosyltransferase [Acidobacteriota bacterium]
MSISTKTGDNGTTSLWSGERVKKNCPRVEAYGTVDELNSNLAEAKHIVKTERVKVITREIQEDLFQVAGALASVSNFVYPITDAGVERITRYVHEFEAEVKLTGFVIPGNTLSSAKLDVCRTVARRAERRILTLAQEEDVPVPIIKYINRLSDLIYMMARFEEKNEGKLEFKKW